MSKHHMYALAPNGTMGMRAATRPYTHAVAAQDPKTGAWSIRSYHGTEAHAMKQRDTCLAAPNYVSAATVVETHSITSGQYARLKAGRAEQALIQQIQAQRAALRGEETTVNDDSTETETVTANQSAGDGFDILTVAGTTTDMQVQVDTIVTCWDHDGGKCKGTVKAWHVEATGDTVLTLWDGDRHRYFSVNRIVGIGTAPEPRTTTAQAAPAKRERVAVDVHDYVRGDRQRCTTCGGARNIKAHTHIANKGA